MGSGTVGEPMTLHITGRLILIVSIVYFMISSWDDFIDLITKQLFGLRSDVISDALIRALVATIIVVLILKLQKINIGDVFGFKLS